MENLSSINLDVLSSVQYWQRSLEATVRIRLKTRGRRLKSKTWAHQRTLYFREHISIRAHPKASIPTLKPSSIQEPRSFIARHTKLILQQSGNITLSTKIQVAKSYTKPRDTSKLTTGHFIALQREEIQFHPPEHRCKLLQPGNRDKPIVQPHPQGGTSTIKRNHKPRAYRKATPNTAT